MRKNRTVNLCHTFAFSEIICLHECGIELVSPRMGCSESNAALVQTHCTSTEPMTASVTEVAEAVAARWWLLSADEIGAFLSFSWLHITPNALRIPSEQGKKCFLHLSLGHDEPLQMCGKARKAWSASAALVCQKMFLCVGIS